MAPTEILAYQHYESITEYVAGMDIEVAFLSGSIKGKARQELLDRLLAGEIDILLGTHALIEPWVEFKNLGLAIIDEQHRFGVKQRAKLWVKNKPFPPHVLLMTATPIPRTLAMTTYGDLDVSVIDELPPGRTPIQTVHFTEHRRERVFGRIREEIAKGTLLIDVAGDRIFGQFGSNDLRAGGIEHRDGEIVDVEGDPKDLVGSPLLMSEAVKNADGPSPGKYAESWTWTFYKFATVKGYVTIRWLGQSNGYYGETATFYRLPAAEATR